LTDDQDARNGRQQQAQISWFVRSLPSRSLWWLTVFFVGYRDVFRFFTLAHEIAHNLIEPHNSEHEFYFSAICEAHMIALSRLIGAVEV
jgi:hypothetical protein